MRTVELRLEGHWQHHFEICSTWRRKIAVNNLTAEQAWASASNADKLVMLEQLEMTVQHEIACNYVAYLFDGWYNDSIALVLKELMDAVHTQTYKVAYEKLYKLILSCNYLSEGDDRFNILWIILPEGIHTAAPDWGRLLALGYQKDKPMPFPVTIVYAPKDNPDE